MFPEIRELACSVCCVSCCYTLKHILLSCYVSSDVMTIISIICLTWLWFTRELATCCGLLWLENKLPGNTLPRIVPTDWTRESWSKQSTGTNYKNHRGTSICVLSSLCFTDISSVLKQTSAPCCKLSRWLFQRWNRSPHTIWYYTIRNNTIVYYTRPYHTRLC